MTQQEFKKAKSCISALKWQNFWLGLRTFMTLLAFICAGLCMLAVNFVNLGLISGEGVLDAYVASFYLALMDWFGFFFMKIFGAFSLMSLSDFISPDGEYYSIITNVVYVLGMLIMILLFSGLKQPKKTTAVYGWFTAISVMDIITFIVYYIIIIYAVYKGGSLDAFVILWPAFCFGVLALADILTIKICKKAKENTIYLNSHFEQGTALKKRELKKIYREENDRDLIARYQDM